MCTGISVLSFSDSLFFLMIIFYSIGGSESLCNLLIVENVSRCNWHLIQALCLVQKTCICIGSWLSFAALI